MTLSFSSEGVNGTDTKISNDKVTLTMLSPSQHYEVADKLLEQVAQEDIALPYVRHKVLRASVHAQLAQCRWASRLIDQNNEEE